MTSPTAQTLTTKPNILVADVANGLTRLGYVASGELQNSWESSTPRHVTTDEVRAQVVSFLDRAGAQRPDGAILSCVVPSHSDAWAAALSDVSATRALVMGPGLRTGMRMRIQNPAEVGSDRVANVVAARGDYGAPVVVVSLGTTTNLEVVDDKGAFVGGIIAPGPMLGMRALSEAAARLPMAELSVSDHLIGRNTREAMQSGVVRGEAVRIDGFLDALEDELGGSFATVVTGHHASAIFPLLRHEAVLDRTLTLRGLARVWYGA